MAKQSNNATSEENQKVESESKDTSAKKKNIESPEEKEITLTDEQWEAAYKSSRFKDLNERAKKAEAELAKEQKAKDKELQEKLKEEGKLEELLEEKEKAIEKLTSSLDSVNLRNQIMSVASKLKVVDTDVVEKLIDKEKLQKDNEGNYLNVENVVQELISDKPYLAGAQSDDSSNIGGNANATTESQSGDFVITKSELRENLKDHSWYIENKDNIEQWRKEGRIDNSR